MKASVDGTFLNKSLQNPGKFKREITPTKHKTRYYKFYAYSPQWGRHHGKSPLGDIHGDINFQDPNERNDGKHRLTKKLSDVKLMPFSLPCQVITCMLVIQVE